MNKYEQRKAEREREAGARHQRITEEHHYLHMTIADRYEEAYKAAYGVPIKIKYSNGWYTIKHAPGIEHKYRGIQIVKFTDALLALAHEAQVNSQIEHPEYLKEDN
jgi:hypothetical protein